MVWEIRELKGQCVEVERGIEVLKAARSFCAWECDPLSR